MASAKAVPVVPNFEAPKGNWIARNLRLVNEDSRELFPQSVAGSRAGREDKFNTMYKVDFHNYPTQAFIDGLLEKGKEPKRETIRDVLFGNSPSEIFQNWKIPNRLVPEPAPDARDAAAYAAVLSGKRDTEQPRPPPPQREATLPVIMTSRQQKLSQQTPFPPSRSYTTIDGAELRGGARDRLGDSLQPHTLKMADDWLKQAPSADRKVIERVLRMQEKQHQLDNAMRKSLKPDARKTVEDWMEGASDSERQVALRFFTSVAGAKLMGSTAEEQKGRLQQVIRTLQAHKGHPGGPTRRSLDSAMAEKESKLKYVRLLDNQTRSNRWMHTTWHHLPEYKNDNPVNNRSSHYVRPHAPTPRHFVIHPDWG